METFSDKRMLWPEPQGCLGQEWWNLEKQHLECMSEA